MEVDTRQELLSKLAAGGSIDRPSWPDVRSDMLARLDQIARESFPIPNLPPPRTNRASSETRLLSPLPSSSPLEPSSQGTNKENAPAERPSELTEARLLEPGELPKQLADMLAGIKAQLQTFDSYPPHTIQRLAELILKPQDHYRALPSYLHAVDRVVQVTSGTDTFPLPPAVPDMSGIRINGGEAGDLAATVSWGNPATAMVGSDEALGGALLTPIPWLTRRSPESNGDSHAAQIHSESTETISGPNGMGSVETVSVSVNGVPSTGHTRGVTQGELLRQEQRAGVVPISQLARTQDVAGEEEQSQESADRPGDQEGTTEEEETPHARGPEDIGVGDTGPQSLTTSYMGEGGVVMRGIDVEAAVGRKHDGDGVEDAPTASLEQPSSNSIGQAAGTKREAEPNPEGGPTKKIKEDGEPASPAELDESNVPPAEAISGGDVAMSADGAGDKMETDVQD